MKKDLIVDLELEIQKHIDNNILIQQSTLDAINLILHKHKHQMLESMATLTDVICNVRNKMSKVRVK